MTPIEINAALTKAKKQNKVIRVVVEKNLYLCAYPTGAVTYVGKIKINGKTYNKSFGEVALKDAKKLKDEWAATLKVIPETTAPSYTVRDAFNDWYEKKQLTARSFDYMKLRVERHIIPKFGNVPLKDLTAYALIKAWKPLEAKGQIETLRKLCDYVKDMAVFVQNTGRLEEMHDLTHIKANYPRKQAEHLAAVTPAELPDLFYALECKPRVYGVVWYAMMCQFYTLGRPGEIALMQWSWVDFDKDVIHFPASVMKTHRDHDVPMSRQLRVLLQNMPKIYDYVFFSDHSKRLGEPINKESVRLMFSKAGLGGTQTAHGIRSIGRTWMAENNIGHDVAEMCLAHRIGSSVEMAYNRTDFIDKRREAMQRWCDFVDECRAEAHERIKAELNKK